MAHGISQKKAQDLVNIAHINPNICLDIRYASKNNFTKQAIYPSARCYLRRAVAVKLNKVQKKLEEQGLGLKIYDGYRPLSVQKKIWEICPNPNYVARPSKGSVHNRGASVDLTLINVKTGRELEMPSQFDDFTQRAHREYDKMSSEIAKKNCKLLEDIMVKYGFEPYAKEWWHFNDQQWMQYEVLDISFEQLEKKK